MPPFTLPEFLQGQDADAIHRRMMANIPDDIDKSELSIPWDFTRPSAIEKAEFIAVELSETIKLIFPHWAYERWLDLHAEIEGITRRPANRAFGYLTVKGRPGIVILRGFLFATAANLTPSVIFEAVEDVTIGNGSYDIRDTAAPQAAVIRLTLNTPTANLLAVTLRPTQDDPDVGELLLTDGAALLERFAFGISAGTNQAAALMEAVETAGSEYFTLEQLTESDEPLAAVSDAVIGTLVPVQAVEGGRVGNVPPDSIILMVRPDSGIAFIKNAEATTGGAPEESDDELRERILEVIRQGLSWTGNDSDYVRWAMEVPGVGGVMPDPEWDDPSLPEGFVWIDSLGNRRKAGAVRLFIIDANGLPANPQILENVYNHIINPANRKERKAPVGAHLTIVAPEPMTVDISAQVFLRQGENLGIVTDRFKASIFQYWLEATRENAPQDVFSGISQNFVKYVQVGARLAKAPGLKDYSHETFTINGGTENILIPPGFFPVTGEVNLYE